MESTNPPPSPIMYSSSYYVQEPNTLEWTLRVQINHATPPRTSYQYHQVPIIDYMGRNWQTANALLFFLLSNPSLRRHLLKQIAHDPPSAWNIIHFTHPLLHDHPFCIHMPKDDIDFYQAIYKYWKSRKL
jgi:hypothetical protein